MILLIIGLLLWSVIHLIPATARPFRAKLIDKLGEKAYQGLFAVSILSSVGIIVLGWRSITPSFIYALPELRPVALGIMVIAYALMGAAMTPTRIKQYVRHPQLTGTILWSIAHLLLNGDSRSLVLFTGIGLWAIIEIICINRRDGEWVKPPLPTAKQETITAVISVSVFVVTIFLHPYLSGIALI